MAELCSKWYKFRIHYGLYKNEKFVLFEICILEKWINSTVLLRVSLAYFKLVVVCNYKEY